ncbi:hypothetical protein BpHYR1_046466 [Brachionus plicatilis]|uniref:Uncharacterized protein n=1 Tax=Brachionus plicatilis TaxID=10195 RepID=A0A3M7PBX1_BRAPC|nr:hypothetical protein BpHYR1_046466 [Brachionus plicatilis]
MVWILAKIENILRNSIIVFFDCSGIICIFIIDRIFLKKILRKKSQKLKMWELCLKLIPILYSKKKQPPKMPLKFYLCLKFILIKIYGFDARVVVLIKF